MAMATDIGGNFTMLEIPRIQEYLRDYIAFGNKSLIPSEKFLPQMYDWFTLSLNENDEHEYRGHDKSNLLYLRMPKADHGLLRFDLNIMHDNDEKELKFTDFGKRTIDTFLHWIIDHEETHGSQM
jgi:hypothetical protein